jgi:hypothetical protein
MKIRDVFIKDPATIQLKNDGVAKVNESFPDEVLQYELQTFVCEGQYEIGLARIINSFISNVDQAQQPAVWISGFYGSGKSHLVNMLRALWVDKPFSDGISARQVVAKLPHSVSDQLVELSRMGTKLGGGLHAVGGDLSAGATSASTVETSIRLALLGMVFKSVKLPEAYNQARFVLFLRDRGCEQSIREAIEKQGLNWEKELRQLHVSTELRRQLVAQLPEVFPSSDACIKILTEQYPNINDGSKDITSNELVQMLRDVLQRDGKLPLTLIAIDELQQYIGDSSQRALAVQELVETCSKRLDSRVLFVATGQSAILGTSNLSKLEGRFTVRIQLSDTDVDAVVRKVVLLKKPQVLQRLEDLRKAHAGEIASHLLGSQLAYSDADFDDFALDYPILPVRRRFWEQALRVVDATGTQSQLRNQLSMVHRVVNSYADKPLGTLVSADEVFFANCEKMLQAAVLDKNLYEDIMRLRKAPQPDQQLTARLIGLVFLINKIADRNPHLGLKADLLTLAQLISEDLSVDTRQLALRIEGLLVPAKCPLVMRIEDIYRVQTLEGREWENDFRAQEQALNNDTVRIETERADFIRKQLADELKNLSYNHGESKTTRQLEFFFDSQLPADSRQRLYAWIQDGWNQAEDAFRAHARNAGTESPSLFVFLPNRSADPLRKALIAYKAAAAVIDQRRSDSSPGVEHARAAMMTRRDQAQTNIQNLVKDIIKGASVYKGGGTEVHGSDLRSKMSEALKSAVERLYTEFAEADHARWNLALEAAQKGQPDALAKINFKGEPEKHPVCRQIIQHIGNGATGKAIRDHFAAPPYGWPQDAIDAALYVLLNANIIRCEDPSRKVLSAIDLQRKDIGKSSFFVEEVVVTASDRMALRSLCAKLDIPCKDKEELAAIPPLLRKLRELAQKAGGDPPRPQRPQTEFLDQIERQAGNAQLREVVSQAKTIETAFQNWTQTAKQIQSREPAWQLLDHLARHAQALESAQEAIRQHAAIRDNRLLLHPDNPVETYTRQLADLLRAEINQLMQRWQAQWDEGENRLEQDPNWQALSPEQRNALRRKENLTQADKPQIDTASLQTIDETLRKLSLSNFADRIAALPRRYDETLTEAARLCQPQAQEISIPRRTLTTQAELQSWIDEVKAQAQAALEAGKPVILK